MAGRRYFEPEGAHELRVAAGRLRVWLALAGLRVLDDDLRLLRDALALLRDLDVQIEADPPQALGTWLAWQRAAARHAGQVVLRSRGVEGLLQALGSLPALPEPGRRAVVRPLWHRVARAGATLKRSPGDITAHHLLRRRVRRLRYALEWLEGPAGRVQRLQEQLGEAQDLARRLALIGAFHSDPDAAPHPDVDAYEASARTALDGALERAAGAWSTERARLRRELTSWMSS